jgi:hypothetical protein
MAPAPLTGYLCEQCLDAPAVAFVPAPWGGEMGVCEVCGAPPVRRTYECWRHDLSRAHSPTPSPSGRMMFLTCGICGVRCVTTAVLWQAEVARRAAANGREA